MKHAIWLLLTFLSLSCSAGLFGTPKLHIKNNTSKKITVQICRGTSPAVAETTPPIYENTFSGNEEKSDIKVSQLKKGDKVVVLGNVEGLTNKVRFITTTVTSANQNIDIYLDVNFTEIPPLTTSDQALASLSPSIPKNTESFGTINNLFSSAFGGLVLVRTDKDGKPVRTATISPATLKSVTRPDYSQGSTNTVIINKGDFSTQAKLGLPIVGVSANVQQNTSYQFTYTLVGANVQQWSPPGENSLPQLFAALSQTDKDYLVKTYLADSTRTSKLYQIDHVYLFRTMSISVESFTATNSTVDASALGYISAGLATNHSNTGNFSNTQMEMVLNMWYENDYTSLIQNEAVAYLDRQKQAIQTANNPSQVKTMLNASFTPEEKSSLQLNDSTSKTQVLNRLSEEITIQKAAAIH